MDPKRGFDVHFYKQEAGEILVGMALLASGIHPLGVICSFFIWGELAAGWRGFIFTELVFDILTGGRKVKPAASEIAAYLDGMIRQEMWAQTFRYQERWEPRVIGLLCNAADAALHRLRPVLVEYGLTADKARHLPAVKVAIAEIVTQVTEQQVARAQAMLLKMVNYESNRLLDALTLGGIAGQAGTVDLHEWEEQDLANRLAGGDDLANASSRSALLFTAKVEEIFTASTNQSEASSTLTTQLEQAVQWWRGRLGTIARTTVHAVANRVRHILSSGMR